jgi:hypothetical protein
MLLFKQKFIEQIITGKKTVTRRPVKDPNRRPAVPGSVHYARRNYTDVPGIKIYIQDVWIEPIEDITEQEARAEGLNSRKEFLEEWEEIYGERCDTVWVIRFELYDTYLKKRPTLEKWGA